MVQIINNFLKKFTGKKDGMIQRRPRKPMLSLIIIGYNMQRELPRTIRSLSPEMQRGVEADDYEIILVDNGSTIPVDVELCRSWRAHLHY